MLMVLSSLRLFVTALASRSAQKKEKKYKKKKKKKKKQKTEREVFCTAPRMPASVCAVSQAIGHSARSWRYLFI
jgi:invasion protein IalB